MDLSKIEGLTEDQINSITGQVDDDIKGLKDKNSELLGKISKGKNSTTELESEITRLRALEDQVKQDEALSKKNYDEALKLVNESSENKINELSEQLTATKQLNYTMLVDNGLSLALDSINIIPGLKQGALSMLKPQVTVKDGKAVVNDASLSDFIKQWSETDEAKLYLQSANTSGSGSGNGQKNNQDFSNKTSHDKIKSGLETLMN